MTSKVIYTMDVPGEREWILRQFPGHINYETKYSGKWPGNAVIDLKNTIWEIAPEDNTEYNLSNFETYKSVYKEPVFCNSTFSKCKNLLLNINFKTADSKNKSKNAQVLHFARAGTMFLESVLQSHLKYNVFHHMLAAANPDNEKQLNQWNNLKNTKPDCFINFREDWWATISSTIISKKYGYFHYSTKPADHLLTPFIADEDDVRSVYKDLIFVWNYICETRIVLHNLNFYIIEFKDLIKNDQLTVHRQIPYKKEEIILNYSELKKVYEDRYKSKLIEIQNLCLQHLKTMNCQRINDFSQFT